MKALPFLLRLAVLSIFCALGLFFVHRYPPFAIQPILDWLILTLYIVLSLLFFLLAKLSARSADPAAFSRFYLGSIFIKLFSSLLLLLVYIETQQPTGRYYIVPFLLIYACYTVFEVYFLQKIGKKG